MKKNLLWIVAAPLLALSMPGFGVHVFVWFGFSLFLYSLDSGGAFRNFLKGILFGLLYFGICMFWFIPTFTLYIPEVIQSFPAFMGIVVFFLMMLVEAFFYGLFAVVYTLFKKKAENNKLLYCLFVGFLVFATEWLRSIGPMGLTGYRFSDSLFQLTGLLQIASFVGTEGLTILIVIVNARVFQILKASSEQFPKQKIPRTKVYLKKAVLITALISAFYVADSVIQTFLPVLYPVEQPSAFFGGMQTMVTSEEKYSSSELDFIRVFEDSVSAFKGTTITPDFIAYPEAFFMYDIANRSRTKNRLEELSKQENMVFVIPHLSEPSEETFYNAVKIVTPQTGISEMFYGKRHLNPFVETLPFKEILGVLGFLKFSNYFTPGPVAQPLEINGRKYAFPICFEAFDAAIFQDFLKEGAEAFITLTNDVWFSIPVALEQHFAQVHFRAVESRKWVAQVSNNGITGISDPYGRVTSRLPMFERSYGVFELQFPEKAFPSFLDYREICLWIFGFILLGLIIAIVVIK